MPHHVRPTPARRMVVSAVLFALTVALCILGHRSWSKVALASGCDPVCPPVIHSEHTIEDTQSTVRLVPGDDDTTHFLIKDIVGGRLYHSGGEMEIENGEFITLAEGDAGLIFIPGANLNSPRGDTFTFSAQASIGADPSAALSIPVTAKIYVLEANDEPVPYDDTLTMFEDVPIVIPFSVLVANDDPGPYEDGQSLVVQSVAGALHVQTKIIDETETIEITPDANFSGNASFTYTIRDNGTSAGAPNPKVSVAPAIVHITILPVADPPVVPAGLTTKEDTPTAPIVITRNPHDGAEVTHFRITGIENGTLTLSDGVTPVADGDFISVVDGNNGVIFTPAADRHSYWGDSPAFGFTVHGATDSKVDAVGGSTPVAITVINVNDPPRAVDDKLLQIPINAVDPILINPADLLKNDSPGPADELSQTLKITAVRDAVGGTVTIDGDGHIVFTPTPGFGGTHSFVYEVIDNGTTADAPDPRKSSASVTFSADIERRSPPPPPPPLSGDPCSVGGCWLIAAPDGQYVLTSALLDIIFPAGSLIAAPGQSVTVQASPLLGNALADALALANVPPGVLPVGLGFDFEVTGGTIVGPLTLRIPIPTDVLMGVDDPERLGMFRLNEDGTVTFVGGRFVDGTLIVELHSFSRYVVGEVAISFADLEEHWVRTAAERMAAKYVVRGYPDGTFRPGELVTRAEFVAMLVRAVGLRAPATAPRFPDVSDQDWFYSDVAAAAAAGIVEGRSDGLFHPGEAVTRQEAAVMIARALRDTVTDGDDSLPPATDVLTRAEVVSMLYRLWQR